MNTAIYKRHAIALKPVFQLALLGPVNIVRPANVGVSGFRMRVYMSLWYWRERGEHYPLVVNIHPKGIVLRRREAPDTYQVQTGDGRTLWLNGPPPPE